MKKKIGNRVINARASTLGGSEMFTARQARIATIECRKKPGIALHESGKFLKNCGAVSVGEYGRII